MKKSGQKNPRVELKEMGPRFDFKLRRTSLARTEKIKETRRKPRAAVVSVVMTMIIIIIINYLNTFMGYSLFIERRSLYIYIWPPMGHSIVVFIERWSLYTV